MDPSRLCLWPGKHSPLVQDSPHYVVSSLTKAVNECPNEDKTHRLLVPSALYRCANQLQTV